MFDLKNLGVVFEGPATDGFFPLPYCPYETLIYNKALCYLDLSGESMMIYLWGDLTLKERTP